MVITGRTAICLDHRDGGAGTVASENIGALVPVIIGVIMNFMVAVIARRIDVGS